MQNVKQVVLLLLLASVVFMLGRFFWEGPGDDVTYLARNLVFETLQDSHTKARAGNAEVIKELEAISRVVFARKRAGRRGGFENTIKGVVCQRKQFSWTLNPLGCEKRPTNRDRYDFMVALAKKHIAGEFQYQWPRENECVMWYKRSDEARVSKRSKRWFDKRLRQVVVYGSHRFYCKRESVREARSER